MTKDKGRMTNAVFFFVLFASFPLSAAVTAEKTPNDVYRQVLHLADDVRKLRKADDITSVWPHVEVEGGREPRHVFQKTLEILNKISHYRMNIDNTGRITVPRFPGRDITPNEVFSAVIRLRQELNLLVQNGQGVQEEPQKQEKQVVTKKTPSHIYAALAEVSIALGETLGLRGITPSEVYARSLQVIELAQFLRRSQSQPLNEPKPARTQGKLPNHALKSVYDLLRKIQRAERNLWMKPLKLPVQPRRVITPSDVYDAMGVAMAELQRIQFRLGLEREFPDPELQKGKTPDDVMQNTRWAAALLPEFKLGKPLQQYDRSALRKTPNQVFSITEHILQELKHYRRLRGIQIPPRKTRMIRGLRSQHVYGKALEIMEKVDVLRRRQNLAPVAVPSYPLRNITPTEVFDLVLRLDEELALLYDAIAMKPKPWATAADVGEYEDKQPSDVFLNMQRISHLLDTILGSEGFTPNDVYREVLIIKRNVQLIADSLGETIPAKIWSAPIFNFETKPHDVLAYAREVQDLIVMAKRRAGIFGGSDIVVPPGDTVTPIDMFNQVRLIETELTEFKVFLGISVIPEQPPVQEGKTLAHVLNVMKGIAGALRTVLHVQIGQT
ncbi:MAG: hypothetical protein GY862_25020 [Gammaproteobacteria bacterium]|nr:hypothetical protein [Gammaproteobacteria bacterium]